MKRHNTLPFALLLSLTATSSITSATSWHTSLRRTLPFAALYLAYHKPRHVQASMDSQTQDRIRAKKMLHLRNWEHTKIDIMEEIEHRNQKFSRIEDAFFLFEGFADIAMRLPVLGFSMFTAKKLYENSESANTKRNALYIMKQNEKKLDSLSLEAYEDLPCFFPCVRLPLPDHSPSWLQRKFLKLDDRTFYLYDKNESYDLYTGKREHTFKCNLDDNYDKLVMFSENPVGPFEMQTPKEEGSLFKRRLVVGKLPNYAFLSWIDACGMIVSDVFGDEMDRLTYEGTTSEGFFGTYKKYYSLDNQKPKLQFDEDRFLVMQWLHDAWEHRMRLYNLKDKELTRTFEGEISRDGLYTKLSDHTFASVTKTKIQIFDIDQSSPIAVLEDEGVRSVLQWDENYLLAGNEDGTIAVWDMRKKECIYRFTRSAMSVVSLVKMDDETLLVGTHLVIYYEDDIGHGGASCMPYEATDYTVFKLIGDTIIDKI